LGELAMDRIAPPSALLPKPIVITRTPAAFTAATSAV
jgi:hypothetical protein